MSRKRESRLLLVSVVAGLAVAGAAAPAAQAEPIETEVVYRGSNCQNGACTDFGRIESPKARCRSDRKVKGIDSFEQVFDTDRSSEKGAWALRRDPNNGFNRVRAPEKEFEGKRDCAADTQLIP